MKLKIKVDGKEHEVDVEEKGDKLKVNYNNKTFEVETTEIKEEIKVGAVFEPSGENIIKAPIPGIISKVHVQQNDQVKIGDLLLTFVAMKMENQIKSPRNGVVKEIKVKENDKIEGGDVLIVLD